MGVWRSVVALQLNWAWLGFRISTPNMHNDIASLVVVAFAHLKRSKTTEMKLERSDVNRAQKMCGFNSLANKKNVLSLRQG